MIAIVNYGSGNLQAISNIYRKLNIDHLISDNESEIEQATKLILPGVGAFDEVMGQLNDSGLRNVLNRQVLNNKVPVLGICVGMQILAKSSDEGDLDGLGWIDGQVRKLDISQLKHKPFVPHMGWNTAIPTYKSNITDHLNIEKGFYFLHSYYFECNNDEDILMKTNYGSEFTSGIKHDNVIGMQFHPEKSHTNGIQIFKNFANL